MSTTTEDRYAARREARRLRLVEEYGTATPARRPVVEDDRVGPGNVNFAHPAYWGA